MDKLFILSPLFFLRERVLVVDDFSSSSPLQLGYGTCLYFDISIVVGATTIALHVAITKNPQISRSYVLSRLSTIHS